MPVLGHAVVGLAIGMATRPPARADSHRPGVENASVLWLPAVVVLAYLPDIITQVGVFAGWSDARLLGHSILFAVTVSAAIAAPLSRVAAVSFHRAFIISLVSLVIHDMLDLAQTTDRAPWWPLSERRVGFDLSPLPADPVREAAVFLALFIGFLVLLHIIRRLSGHSVAYPLGTSGCRKHVWLGRVLIAVIFLAALLTHGLRAARESQLEVAGRLLEQRAYQASLDTLAGAERWPSTDKPGRVDYLRAEAYAGLGDRQAAETHYLRAYRADPGYFWIVADLALFYAASGQPIAERRQQVAPYVYRLRAEFARHPGLPRVLAGVDRKLAGFGAKTIAPPND